MFADEFGHLKHIDGRFAAEDGFELIVRVNLTPIFLVLQVLLFDIRPQFLNHFRPGRS